MFTFLDHTDVKGILKDFSWLVLPVIMKKTFFFKHFQFKTKNPKLFPYLWQKWLEFIYSLTKLLHCYVIPYCSFAVCSITRVQAKVVDSFRRQRQRTHVMRRINTMQYGSAIFKPGDISQRICIHCAPYGGHLANPWFNKSVWRSALIEVGSIYIYAKRKSD